MCESIEYIRPANCQLLFYTLSIVNHTPETPTMWTLSQGAYKKTMKETWLAKKLSVFLAFLHSLRCFGQKMHRHVCGKGKRVVYHLVMYYSLIIHSVICSYSVIHSNSVFLNSSLGGSDVFPKKNVRRESPINDSPNLQPNLPSAFWTRGSFLSNFTTSTFSGRTWGHSWCRLMSAKHNVKQIL